MSMTDAGSPELLLGSPEMSAMSEMSLLPLAAERSKVLVSEAEMSRVLGSPETGPAVPWFGIESQPWLETL
jgi:hypothetical protein